jgi:hypothetical protein
MQNKIDLNMRFFVLDPGFNWSGVTLNDFTSCPYNLAHDRQTRMLADLTLVGCKDMNYEEGQPPPPQYLCAMTPLVGCYNASALPTARRRAVLLRSAKQNLVNMAFFGLTERQEDTRYLFEKRFGVPFLHGGSGVDAGKEHFAQYNWTHAGLIAKTLANEKLRKVHLANELDIELYQFARRLFDKRLQDARSREGRTKRYYGRT